MTIWDLIGWFSVWLLIWGAVILIWELRHERKMKVSWMVSSSYWKLEYMALTEEIHSRACANCQGGMYVNTAEGWVCKTCRETAPEAFLMAVYQAGDRRSVH